MNSDIQNQLIKENCKQTHACSPNFPFSRIEVPQLNVNRVQTKEYQGFCTVLVEKRIEEHMDGVASNVPENCQRDANSGEKDVAPSTSGSKRKQRLLPKKVSN